MEMAAFKWMLSVLIICGIFEAQAQLNFDKLDLQNQLPEGVSQSNFSINDAKVMVHKKCVEVSGEAVGNSSFNEIEAGIPVLTECVGNIVNYTTMQQEIEEASPRGELDVVFNKYCAKRSTVIDCFNVFTTKLVPCLDKEEQESQEVVKSIVQSLLNFVCHKDGDQIALFIAEEGPECLKSQKDNIQQCINTTFSSHFNNDVQDVHNISLPKLVIGEKECGDIKTLEICIVRHLEHCSKITPANLIESMFNFIRNKTLCRNYHYLPLTANNSAHTQSNNYTFNILMCSIFIFTLVFKIHFLE